MIIKQNSPFPGTALAQVSLGKGLFAIVDPEDFGWLSEYRWFARKSKCRWYAMRKFVWDGKEHTIRMHRQIMNAPPGIDVHHVHGQTFDNRKSELELLDPKVHAALRIQR